MQYLLFTTTSCPKCPAFKRQLELTLATVAGRVIDERDADFAALAQRHSVGNVPLLIVFDDEAGESAVLRTGEVSDLLGFARTHAL